MRPEKLTPAHHTGQFAELVCSNSLKSDILPSAAATLKSELQMMGSFVLECARECNVAAGNALAVDRDLFSALVTKRICSHANIRVVRDEVQSLMALSTKAINNQIIVASGPLTSDALVADIQKIIGRDYLSFYDAAAPIVAADSLDMKKIFAQSRYDNGTPDYLNAPMNNLQYNAFIEALLGARRVQLKDFERRELFAACQPLEEVARTGNDALRFGALKPVGLIDPMTGRRPWAAVQLRAENASRTAYNLVGFQTNLTFPEQERVFRMIPGLEQVRFERFGVMHRNTFIDTPHVLGKNLQLPMLPHIRFAGQITGTEGYAEAIASGLFASLAAYAALLNTEMPTLPEESVFGALLAYATNAETLDYQPMHVNFGIVPPVMGKLKKRERYCAYSERALQATKVFVQKCKESGLL
jgi:methylenetetrahydrofolate--tRNA-(uracil-5-)-methyltransferase